MASKHSSFPASPVEPDRTPGRRSFFKEVAAVVIGGLVTLFPFAAGLVVFLDPLRRKGDASDFVRVTTKDAVPNDGQPRLFQIVRDRTDAWSKYLNEPVGAVYLRNADGKVTAHNAECPHAGCYVAFSSEAKIYQCPCHDSRFDASGERIDPLHCPSPRDLDPLAVETRPGAGGHEEVWVKFENFLAGTSERISRV